MKVLVNTVWVESYRKITVSGETFGGQLVFTGRWGRSVRRRRGFNDRLRNSTVVKKIMITVNFAKKPDCFIAIMKSFQYQSHKEINMSKELKL